MISTWKNDGNALKYAMFDKGPYNVYLRRTGTRYCKVWGLGFVSFRGFKENLSLPLNPTPEPRHLRRRQGFTYCNKVERLKSNAAKGVGFLITLHSVIVV